MRKAKPKKRIVLPDPVFNDVRVSKFVNHLMYDGKKNTAYTIFYNALEIVKAKLPNEEATALEIWKKPWRTLLRKSRSRAVVSAVPLSRCLPRYAPTVRNLYP